MAIRLVESIPEDREFLYQVYAASRASEMALVPWTDEQKEAFLRWQFDLQDRHYRGQFPGAQFQVILEDDCQIGRLYWYETPEEIHVMDIALMPERRGAGIGGTLIRDIVSRAAASNRAVTLHVEHHNPARRLYDRLGFQIAGDDQIYVKLEWRPAASSAPG
jgi:ribosomal protein S18 acetylase RimI-like enzyme